jgi:hypothetical protein
MSLSAQTCQALSRSTIAKLVAAYEAGQSRDELSDAFGIALSWVSSVPSNTGR